MKAKRLAYLLLTCILLITGCGKKQPAGDNTPAARLHLAAQKGDLKLVQSLMARGCDVDARDKDGYTALYTAAAHGQAELVKFLLAKGADVNAKADNGATALNGVGRGHTDIARMLIAAGAQINDELGGCSALYGAGWFDEDKEMAELLLANGAQIIPGDTPDNERLLFFAIENELPDLVAKLLVGGADANAMDLGRTGLSLVAAAVYYANREAARLLIAHGAEVNRRDLSGLTPLHYANSRNKDAVEVLLANGADVNAGGVLHTAVERGDKEIVELFLEHGADPSAKNHEGDTPLDEALARGFTDIAEILRKHGAK